MLKLVQTTAPIYVGIPFLLCLREVCNTNILVFVAILDVRFGFIFTTLFDGYGGANLAPPFENHFI